MWIITSNEVSSALVWSCCWEGKATRLTQLSDNEWLSNEDDDEIVETKWEHRALTFVCCESLEMMIMLEKKKKKFSPTPICNYMRWNIHFIFKCIRSFFTLAHFFLLLKKIRNLSLQNGTETISLRSYSPHFLFVCLFRSSTLTRKINKNVIIENIVYTAINVAERAENMKMLCNKSCFYIPTSFKENHLTRLILAEIAFSLLLMMLTSIFVIFSFLHSPLALCGRQQQRKFNFSTLFFSSSSSSSWLGVCECGEHFSIGIFILSIVETEEKLNFLLSSSVCVSVENKVEKSHQHNQISTQAQARRDQRKKKWRKWRRISFMDGFDYTDSTQESKKTQTRRIS